MRVNRRFLYAGAFLLAIGAVLVAADLNLVDTPILIDALRLWPLALVAIGVSLVIRRTQFSLGGGMVAAALPGLVLGSVLAAAPRFVEDCGVRAEPAEVHTAQGTFEGDAAVSVTSGCGTLNVTTVPGNAWQLEAGNTDGRSPIVNASAESLSVAEANGDGWRLMEGGRNSWDLALPAGDVRQLSLEVNTGHSRVELPGADLEQVTLEANAAHLILDASGAKIADLTGNVDLGFLSIQLPADGDLTGAVHVGGGALELCTSPGAGLRVTARGTPREITVEGVETDESTWQSPDYSSAIHRADINVRVNFGGIEINPIGGCK